MTNSKFDSLFEGPRRKPEELLTQRHMDLAASVQVAIIAYLSDGNATAKTINMSAITSASSTAVAWWYAPLTGAATLIGTFPNSGSQIFRAPDGNDWCSSLTMPPQTSVHRAVAVATILCLALIQFRRYQVWGRRTHREVQLFTLTVDGTNF